MRMTHVLAPSACIPESAHAMNTAVSRTAAAAPPPYAYYLDYDYYGYGHDCCCCHVYS